MVVLTENSDELSLKEILTIIIVTFIILVLVGTVSLMYFSAIPCLITIFVSVPLPFIYTYFYSDRTKKEGQRIIENVTKKHLSSIVCPHCKTEVSVQESDLANIPLTISCPYCSYPFLARWGEIEVEIPNPKFLLFTMGNVEADKNISKIIKGLISEKISTQLLEQIGGDKIDIRDSIVQHSKIGSRIKAHSFCPNCGIKIATSETPNFCSNCGYSMVNSKE